jgi:hypothetical protein
MIVVCLTTLCAILQHEVHPNLQRLCAAETATLMFAQVLFSSDGYAYLDVRPTLELEEVGRVKDSVNIPLYNSIRKYDAEKGEKVRAWPRFACCKEAVK